VVGKWQIFYCKFLAESSGERILEIDQHLAVINEKCRWSFFDSQCIWGTEGKTHSEKFGRILYIDLKNFHYNTIPTYRYTLFIGVYYIHFYTNSAYTNGCMAYETALCFCLCKNFVLLLLWLDEIKLQWKM